MFDSVILLIDKYAIWLAILIAAYKILHIILYKGLQPGYIINNYFIIYDDVEIIDSKSFAQRRRYRKVHNTLTISFYAIFLIWLIVHLILITV